MLLTKLVLALLAFSRCAICEEVEEDAYVVLGLKKDATSSEIRRAYRKLSLKHHPDKNPGDPNADERFRRINKAYEQIGEEDARTLYDAYGSAEFDNQWEFKQAQRMGKIKKMQSDFYVSTDYIKNIKGQNDYDTYLNIEAGLFGGALLIEFYAPWCVHCQHLMPVFKKTAALLEGVAAVAAVNCERRENKRLCRQIKGYPTLKLYSRVHDVNAETYNDEHKPDVIYRWVKRSLDPALIRLDSENYQTEVMESDDIWLVDFSAGAWCPPCQATKSPMREIAVALKGLVKCGIINCDVEKDLCESQEVPHFPHLVIFPRNKSTPPKVLGTDGGNWYPQVKMLHDFSKISQALLNDVLIERFQKELPPKLKVLFEAYEPERVEEIPALMTAWKGKERALWNSMLEDYDTNEEDVAYLFEENAEGESGHEEL